MESNNGVLNIDINSQKNENYININMNNRIKNKEKINQIIDIIKEDIVTKFNTSIIKLVKKINGEKINLITNKEIFQYFTYKYCYSRNLKYLIKNKKIIINNKNKDQSLNYLYSYILFYFFFNSEFIEVNKNKLDMITFDELFRLIMIFYSSKILSLYHIINIWELYLSLLNNNNLSLDIKIKIINRFIRFFSKIIKLINYKEKEKQKELNDLIRKEIFGKIFEIINKHNDNLIYFRHKFRKEESIFLLIKIMANNNIISNDNKIFIKEYIINFLMNNFRKEHLNYFYKFISKILLKFNSLNPKNENIKINNLLVKKFDSQFVCLKKIIEIITEVIKKEKQQINKTYYCDKGFVFNIHEKEKKGFKINDIIYQKSKKSVFCILFSFLLGNNNKIENENQLILSICDSEKEYLSLFVQGEKLYLRYFSKKLNKVELLSISYNYYYSFFLYYDKSYISISINNKDISPIKDSDFKIPNNFRLLVGLPESNNKDYTFNGVICPIIIFELVKTGKDGYKLMKKHLDKLKNNYYLIAEEYFNKIEKEKLSNNGKKENVIIDNYKEYYNLNDELENKHNIDSIIGYINKIIVYINPYIVLSSFNKKGKTFKDYTIYEINEKIEKQYSYEFNVVPSLDKGQIFPFKDYNIIPYFKLNNGLNFIILAIETLYNYLILSINNSIYMEFININKENFIKMM